MDDLPPGALIAIAFPLVFAAFWLGITNLIGWIAGWHALAQRFPNRTGAAIKKFSLCSGRMGPFGAGMNHCLNIEVCHEGLRVALPWLLQIPNKPFFVPWNEIQPSTVDGVMWNETQLSFGRPQAGTLTITASFAVEIAAGAPPGKWPG